MDLLLNVSANIAGQIAAGISGVQFSSSTPLIVPGLESGVGGRHVTSASIADIPAQHYEYLKRCHEFKPPYRVGSRWGEAAVSPAGKDGELGAVIEIRKEPATPEGNILFSMGADVSAERYIQAELSYSSLDSQFKIMQFARLPVEFRDGSLVQENATGISGIAIASGLKLLKRAAQIKEFGECHDVAKNTTWMRIVRSLGLDDEERAGSLELTQYTAFYLALLFHEELYDSDEQEMEIADSKHGKSHRMAPTTEDGSLEVDEKARGILKSDGVVEFSSVEEILGYDPSGPVIKVPRYAVTYLPPGSHSAVYSDIVDHPVVELLQTTLFSPSGAQPFAGIVADLLWAARQIYPRDFPLADLP